MRCATWNVNSLRARLPRVEEFLAEHQPDALLLQETKCAPDQFPHKELAEWGYEAIDHSGGRWCGVAVLTPVGSGAKLLRSRLAGEPNPDEARWIEVQLADGTVVVSVYAPNGREVGTVHFEHKLEFFKVAADRVAELAAAGQQLIVGGDMNVAPEDHDVWDITKFDGATHVTAAERSGLSQLRDAGGLVDAHVNLHGNTQAFTWWDYRGGSFHRGFGMRIDHLLVSPAVAERIDSVGIAREYRKGAKPSDHVPLQLNLLP